jgi:selenocysteine lyase/cysteine desulfurase
MTAGANVYISPFEHNAVTRILHHYEEIGKINVRLLSIKENLTYDFEKILAQFAKDSPDLMVVSHASNVIGLISPVEKLCSMAKNYKAITVIDMAQTAGLVDINVGLETIDFAVFAGHKTLYGPTGIGGFAMKPDFDLKPVLLVEPVLKVLIRICQAIFPSAMKWELSILSVSQDSMLLRAGFWTREWIVCGNTNNQNEKNC